MAFQGLWILGVLVCFQWYLGLPTMTFVQELYIVGGGMLEFLAGLSGGLSEC